MGIEILNRDVVGSERDALRALINAHCCAHGDPAGKAHRFNASFVATLVDDWAGVASGWAPANDGTKGRWFYLAELFVDAGLRGRGVGAELLRQTEARAMSCGIDRIWTWTAGYEALAFYQKQGYSVYLELCDYYTSGHARVGLYKELRPETLAKLTTIECDIHARPLTDEEQAAMNAGFVTHSLDHGNPDLSSDRVSFIALEDEELVGIATGLAPRKTNGYSPWFGLGEVFVSKPHQSRGLGGDLLRSLETRLSERGIEGAWLWAAEYEAGFFQHHGYEPFFDMPGYHASGTARIGLKKKLTSM